MNNPSAPDELFIARHKKLFFGEKEKLEADMLSRINFFERTFGVKLYNIDTVTDEKSGECVKFTIGFKF